MNINANKTQNCTLLGHRVADTDRYKNLAVAIVGRAICDYIEILEEERDHGLTKSLEHAKAGLEGYFRSNECHYFFDGDMDSVLKVIRKAVDRHTPLNTSESFIDSLFKSSVTHSRSAKDTSYQLSQSTVA